MAVAAFVVSCAAVVVGVGALGFTWAQFRHEVARRRIERTPNFTFRWDSQSRLALTLHGPEPLAVVSVRVPTSGTTVELDQMPWQVGTERKLPNQPYGSGGLNVVVDARAADGQQWQVPVSAGHAPSRDTYRKPVIEPWWQPSDGRLELHLSDGPPEGYDEATVRLRSADFVEAAGDRRDSSLGHRWPVGYVWALPQIELLEKRFEVIVRCRTGVRRYTSTLTVGPTAT